MTRRVTLAAVVAALAVAAGCGDGASPAPTTPPTTGSTPAASASGSPSPPPSPSEPAPNARFQVERGKVVAGPRRVDVPLGGQVVIEAVTDRTDELHVHGYDKEIELEPGRPGRLTFKADIAGVFEVELHSGVKLCDLRVR